MCNCGAWMRFGGQLGPSNLGILKSAWRVSHSMVELRKELCVCPVAGEEGMWKILLCWGGLCSWVGSGGATCQPREKPVRLHTLALVSTIQIYI